MNVHVLFPPLVRAALETDSETAASCLGAQFVEAGLCLGFVNASGMPVMGPGRT